MRYIKFKPSVKKIKLNPEQAVLSCDCYNTGLKPPTYCYVINFVTVCTGAKSIGTRNCATNPRISNS